MRVCLYQERKGDLKFSGIGKSLENLTKALGFAGVDFTYDPDDRPYDILHVDSFGLRSYVLLKKEKRRGTKILIHAHSTMEDSRNSFTFSNVSAPLIKEILKFFYRPADLLVTPSSDAKKILQSYGLKNRIEILSNGVDIDLYTLQKLAKCRSVFRKEFNISDGEVVVFGIGHVFFRKGITSFINIARKFPGYRFFWAGKQYSAWRVWDPRIRRALTYLPPNVKLLGYRKDIWNIYAGGDIFLYPSWNETQGMVLIEAGVAGKPILCRDLPPYADFLRHGENALLAKDDEQMADYLGQLLRDQSLRDQLSRGARKMAQQQDLRIIGQKLKTIYESMLKK